MTRGVLRLSGFMRDFLAVSRSQQARRGAGSPSLFNPEMQAADFATAGVLAVALFSLRYVLEKFLFTRIFASFPLKKRNKLGENLYYSVYYFCAFAFFALFVLRNSTWSTNLLSNDANVLYDLLTPFPPPMAPAEHLYYSQAFAFYISATAFLVLYDGRRSDFVELFLHHVVTVGLVGMSYLYGYVRAGMLILALHDFGDIFLYFAKYIHYLGYSGIDSAIFAVFALAFYVTRLVMYSRIVYAITFETLSAVIVVPSLNNWAMYFDTYLWHYAFFVLFMTTLLMLHCFWFVLILRMIYREVVLGKKVAEEGDIRSDDEDDGEDEDDDTDSIGDSAVAKEKSM